MFIENNGVQLHVQVDGRQDASAPTIVFANSLGTDLHLWDPIMDLLPKGPRYIRWDKRGHGQSDVPPAPYSMGALISDAEAICDALSVRDCVFVGLSVGGMIAQGLAVKRLDVVRALVLSNTGAKLGTPKLWNDRIAAVRAQGMAALADGIMQRWFAPAFCNSPAVAPWRQMLLDQNPEGYAGVCAAISGTDFMTPTSGLRLPTLGIAGSDDGSTPADLVRETVGLIPGSDFHVIRRAGHLPCVEQPADYARLLTDFLTRTGTL
ncbi:3-oxoadipate enol-lactonase [Loktanella sp. SALINAS62]|uniref:3-oxoadipate enol-lactonase n=1 Tax=Loktanella sp. SALINAS62 TaxID=2706124 RepID=UPI001B8CF93A|nr:3-oxoadipate enol-lactonase [Loktanella sp. SALINAS62]MBS1303961.1 3-oxoadipate enol-lactonase [Loktanella sp. SALINAS62]